MLTRTLRRFPVERHAGGVVEPVDQLLEQCEKLRTLGRREGRQHARLGALGGLRKTLQHAFARARERQVGAAAVARADGTADEAGLLELLDHHAGGRAIEAEQARDRDLVDAGPVLEREQDAVLPVGDAEFAGFLEEERDSNLVRAANHEPGPPVEVFEHHVAQGQFPFHAAARRLPRKRRSTTIPAIGTVWFWSKLYQSQPYPDIPPEIKRRRPCGRRRSRSAPMRLTARRDCRRCFRMSRPAVPSPSRRSTGSCR